MKNVSIKFKTERVPIGLLLLDPHNNRLEGVSEILKLCEDHSLDSPEVQRACEEALLRLENVKGQMVSLRAAGLIKAIKRIRVLRLPNGRFLVKGGNRTVCAMIILVRMYYANPSQFTYAEQMHIKAMMQVEVDVSDDLLSGLVGDMFEHLAPARRWSKAAKCRAYLDIVKYGFSEEQISQMVGISVSELKRQFVARKVFNQLLADPTISGLVQPRHFTKLTLAFKAEDFASFLEFDEARGLANEERAREVFGWMSPNRNGKATADNSFDNLGVLLQNGPLFEEFRNDPSGKMNDYKDLAKAALKPAPEVTAPAPERVPLTIERILVLVDRQAQKDTRRLQLGKHVQDGRVALYLNAQKSINAFCKGLHAPNQELDDFTELIASASRELEAALPVSKTARSKKPV